MTLTTTIYQLALTTEALGHISPTAEVTEEVEELKTVNTYLIEQATGHSYECVLDNAKKWRDHAKKTANSLNN